MKNPYSTYLRRRETRLRLEEAQRAEGQQLLALGAKVAEAFKAQADQLRTQQAYSDAIHLGQFRPH